MMWNCWPIVTVCGVTSKNVTQHKHMQSQSKPNFPFYSFAFIYIIIWGKATKLINCEIPSWLEGMAVEKSFIIEVEKAKEAKDGRPSMGPVYRSIFSKDLSPPSIQGLDSCWDVFRYFSFNIFIDHNVPFIFS